MHRTYPDRFDHSITSGWVYDLQGKEVVFTGKFEGFNEVELTKIAERLGASRVKEWINKSSTDVLVRGWSPHWKYGNYGTKEKQVADMQRAGHHIQIIDTAGFFGLRSHYPAPALEPHVPKAPARANASEGGVAGAPYRSGSFAGPLSDFCSRPMECPCGVRRRRQVIGTRRPRCTVESCRGGQMARTYFANTNELNTNQPPRKNG